MSTRYPGKLVVGLATAVGLGVVTIGLWGRHASAADEPGSEIKASLVRNGTTSKMLKERDNPRDEAEAPQDNGGVILIPISEYGLTSFDLKAIPDGAEVQVKISLADSRRDGTYLWSLLVTNQRATKTFLKTNYVTQTFKIEEIGEEGPGFREQLRLEPGDYQVKVILSRLPDGYDITTLKSRLPDSKFNLGSARGEVTVR